MRDMEGCCDNLSLITPSKKKRERKEREKRKKNVDGKPLKKSLKTM